MGKKKTYLQEKQVHVQTKSVMRIKINSWKVSNFGRKIQMAKKHLKTTFQEMKVKT